MEGQESTSTTAAKTPIPRTISTGRKCPRYVDLGIVLDDSNSISSNEWNDVLEFVENVIMEIDIDSGDVRVGLMTYTDNPVVEFYLNSFSNRADILAKITTIPNRTGTRGTDRALRKMRKDFFSGSNGDRPNARNIGLVITNGKSNDPEETRTEAEKAKDNGIYMIVVGTYRSSIDEINAIASLPSDQNVFRVDGFHALKQIVKKVGQSVKRCSERRCRRKIDLGLVLDSSNSIRNEEWNRIIDFVGHLVKALSVDGDIRIGAISYVDTPVIEFTLKQYSSESEILNALRRISRRAGGTGTDKALRMLWKEFFTLQNGDRSDAKNIALVVTDGKSDSPDDTAKQASKARDNDIQLTVVGVGNTGDLEELANIASGSEDEHVFELDGFDALASVEKEIEDAVRKCHKLKKNQADEECPSDIDLGIVLDDSNSISHVEWRDVLNFAIDLIEELDVNSGKVRVGIVTFTDDAHVEFYLNKHTKTTDIIEAISKIEGKRGPTRTDKALRLLRKQFFSSLNGDRKKARNIGLIVTDGKSDLPQNTIEEAEKVKDEGIHLIAVGIGLSDIDELNVIASRPHKNNIFNVYTSTSLKEITNKLESAMKKCPADCSRQIDLGIVLDASNSVNSKEWKKVLNFVEGLLKMVHIGSGNVRVAVISCAKEPTLLFKLDQYMNEKEILNAIGSIKHKKGSTCTDKGLKMLRKDLFSPDNGDRSNIRNVGIIITDGKSYDPEATVKEAVKAKEDDITLIAVAIGDISINELNAIVSDPAIDVFHVAGHYTLDNIRDSLIKALRRCEDECGEITKDSSKHICCYGKRRDTFAGKYTCCCGRKAFDSRKEICCSNRMVERVGANASSCCSEVSYDQITHICCGGTVQERRGGNRSSCCDRNSYDPQTNICCRGTVIQKTSQSDTGCCGNTSFNPQKQVCCEGEPRPFVNDNRYTVCCGKQGYDPNTQSCCASRVFNGKPAIKTECCDDIAYYPEKELCCGGKLYGKRTDSDDLCCGNETLNSRKHICCDGNTEVKYSDNTICCGQESYEPSNKICCRGKIYKRNQDTECCVDKAFDTSRELCCNGLINVRRKWKADDNWCCGTSTINTNKELCCDGIPILKDDRGSRARCCQNNSFDYVNELCCDGKVINKRDKSHIWCCGDLSYNPIIMFCCNGNLQPYRGSVTLCCNEQSYDPKESICCDGVLHPRRHSYDDQCCGNNIIDSMTERCCGGSVYPVSEFLRKECCNSALIDINTHLCCNDTPRYKRRPDDDVCCGSTTMNSQHNLCCLGFPHPKEWGPGGRVVSTCCQHQSYNVKTQMCCHNVVLTKNGAADNWCCGNMTMDTSKQICCGGKPVTTNNTKNTFCCGLTGYNPRNSLCCNGRVIVKKQHSDTKCCGSITMNPKKELCCGENVLLKINQYFSECCGQNVYDIKSQICCSGNISDRQSSTHDVCCGSSAMNIQRSICCQGRTKDRIVGKQTLCCGTESYDSRSSLCCGDGTIVPLTNRDDTLCCGGSSYNTQREVCCNGHLSLRTENDTACCGNTNYNPETHMCCGQTVVHKNINSNWCCGRYAFSAEKEICCEGVPGQRVAGENTQCCGNISYDPNIRMCCSNILIAKESYADNECCGMQTINTRIQICCSGVTQSKFDIGTHTLCCGTEAIDYDHDLCCNGHVVKKHNFVESVCCGNTKLDPYSEICCNGNPQPKNLTNPYGTECCGNISYNPLSRICCDDSKVQDKIAGDATACCSGVSYNPVTHLCCDGRTLSPKGFPEDNYCCGMSAMNSNTQICCNGEVQPNRGPITKCCLNRSYNPSTHMCCLDEVLRAVQGGENVKCCGHIPYDSNTHLCCEDKTTRLKKTPVDNWCCCNTTYYTKREICCECNVNPFSKLEHTLCCGNKAYDPVVQICCDGMLFYRLYGTETLCCGKAVFNPGIQLCIGEGVIDNVDTDIGPEYDGK